MTKTSIFIFFLFAGLISCKKEDAQILSVKTYTYNELKPLLEKNDGKTYIINFWATWCAPCVKELPYFEKINQEYSDKNVEVLLVSLDFPKQVERKLIPFINKRKLKSEVVLLDDINENVWIKAIDKSWSGAIPATIIYNKNNRKFYEQSFDYKTLKNELLTFLK
ncbi:MAG: thiol-disulfide isomerase/thioredoxin [Flavobacteriaceae bacterium]|jgi:thiol-disulfide isomerase/thioredoxin